MFCDDVSAVSSRLLKCARRGGITVTIRALRWKSAGPEHLSVNPSAQSGYRLLRRCFKRYSFPVPFCFRANGFGSESGLHAKTNQNPTGPSETVGSKSVGLSAPPSRPTSRTNRPSFGRDFRDSVELAGFYFGEFAEGRVRHMVSRPVNEGAKGDLLSNHGFGEDTASTRDQEMETHRGGRRERSRSIGRSKNPRTPRPVIPPTAKEGASRWVMVADNQGASKIFLRADRKRQSSPSPH